MRAYFYLLPRKRTTKVGAWFFNRYQKKIFTKKGYEVKLRSLDDLIRFVEIIHILYLFLLFVIFGIFEIIDHSIGIEFNYNAKIFLLSIGSYCQIMRLTAKFEEWNKRNLDYSEKEGFYFMMGSTVMWGIITTLVFPVIWIIYLIYIIIKITLTS